MNNPNVPLTNPKYNETNLFSYWLLWLPQNAIHIGGTNSKYSTWQNPINNPNSRPMKPIKIPFIIFGFVGGTLGLFIGNAIVDFSGFCDGKMFAVD